MAVPHKEEYPPLLPLGFHEKTLKELHALCVAPFNGRSSTRTLIMQGLETVVTELLAAKIEAKIWVDGSFVSQKIDPLDVDILVELQGGFYDVTTPEQRMLLDALNQNVHKDSLKVDSRAWSFYDNEDSLWYKSFWLSFFGFYRVDGPNSFDTKGMAVLVLPGCDQ